MSAASDLLLITKAASYAGEAHVTQKRKAGEEPYINHPLRVAAAVAEAGLGATAVAAALLHDVVEDTPRTLADLEAEFPPEVCDLVDRLTKWWPDDAPQTVKAEGKPRYYGNICANPVAVAVKLYDRTDNLWSMVRMLPRLRDWAERYLRKSRNEVGPLADVCTYPEAVRAYREAVAALEAKLAETAER